MKTWTLAGLGLACLLAIGGADAKPRNVTDPDVPRAVLGNGPVQVQWTDPAQFSELRQSTNRFEAQRGDWVTQLAEYLQKSATRQLPKGQRLDVTITDIKRAGDFEPWRGPNLTDVRFMRDIYPPRITLRFKLTDANDQVISQGERTLSDMAYLMNSGLRNDTDPLRYEKRLLDDWLRSELRLERANTGQ
ncbi:DUF3016 domain-containing protein [Stenotrophomonas sp. YIM B06876]|uniref:DUF3016 domain-containing protein n=1 Tax=Stenotrophomonas sp. YIM B06876 TaxID=3060211 RepID=UPI00273A3156|nr:DUF3016 domain-containing protein [Stenotrophomonas sp. YIM B06876]